MRSKKKRWEIKKNRKKIKEALASVGCKVKFQHNYTDSIHEIIRMVK